MKLRAMLLVCLLIGGAYAMYISMVEFQVKGFHDILPGPANSVEQLVFTKPLPVSSEATAWIVTDKEEIVRLLSFLQSVEVQKIDTQLEVSDLDFNQFTISLQDTDENRITILTEDHLIVTEAGEQFTVVGDSLDMDWILQFILTNRPDSG
ncbi:MULTISPECIES: hypothetical protein [Sporosarcina]|uniref:hypothetical protein n=1 Tax=Sporosarcina TaxID=1569 RepID=UPI00058EA983|nr:MULTISPECIES: hypothetical protein [Sporosarcina]WJY27904.1 hypothetical protein QWT68_02695 [Sporosarcina sp. 0.2-SM1T-5]